MTDGAFGLVALLPGRFKVGNDVTILTLLQCIPSVPEKRLREIRESYTVSIRGAPQSWATRAIVAT